MKREDFLSKIPLLMFAGASLASLSASAQQDQTQAKQGGNNSASNGTGYKLKSGVGRNSEIMFVHAINAGVRVKVSGKDCNNNFSIFEIVQSKGGPAYHYHNNMDEFLYIIRGEFVGGLGETAFKLKEGDCFFAPRGIHHSYSYVGEGTGLVLQFYQAAGTIENFYKLASNLNSNDAKYKDKLKQLEESNDINVLGPALGLQSLRSSS
ncbi:MAG: cupin domain-containing protein [Phycisphaerales bacterium]|nr:cupin domain-containing protein [Phycisphaerales bacterium]